MPVKSSTRPGPRKGPPPKSRKSIVWLASYPKSGNTWTRIFLANYLMATDSPIPINEVHRVGMGDSIASAYKLVNEGVYDPSDLQGHLRLRDKVMRGITGNGADLNFVKTHNLNDQALGVRLIDPAYTRAAVYILRDPRDLVISYARHYAMTPAETCRAISRADNTVVADATSVTQFLGNWSDHVRGWTKGRHFPVQTIRYEDMQATPEATFEKLLEFLGIPVEPEKLERAVWFSSFDEVKKQELTHGFVEKSPNSDSFFHSGKSRQWEGVLTDGDLAVLDKAHGQQMKRFGYL